MRAIKIDSGARTIKEVEVNDLKDMQREVDGYIQSAFYLHDGSCCMVDEEGLFKSPDTFFQFTSNDGESQPLAGNGLIIGPTDDEGETLPCAISIDYIKKSIRFFDLATLQLYLSIHNKASPTVDVDIMSPTYKACSRCNGGGCDKCESY